MARTSFVTHKGKQVCVLDFSGFARAEDALPHIAEARKIVTAQPLGSTLTLTNVAGSHFNTDVVAALKELANADKPHVKASAIVGMRGIQRAIYVAVMQFTGRKIPTFDTVEQALDWLVEQ